MSTSIIGKQQDRIDGKLKVTGRAMYAGDRQMENLAFGYLLTSTVARGSIQTMDVGSAERSPRRMTPTAIRSPAALAARQMFLVLCAIYRQP